ncbi:MULTISPECIES: hypothetical protein [Methylobacterium]|jgi:hypothetical protein|uniref:hypothetical protein n=1 Tax=Methylobacterium TaxID=407 RepID=UPI0008EC5E11|nr:MULTISPECIES: hypothetical protein [Methylobacterium]SFF81631.1 hypothetical protein SAMN04487844_15213 [Methylobacterium sp. yr596]
MSKKMGRLTVPYGRAQPGRRRHVRPHVARRAARDFRHALLALLLAGTLFNLFSMLASSSDVLLSGSVILHPSH